MKFRFSFNTSQRNGIISLILIIVVLGFFFRRIKNKTFQQKEFLITSTEKQVQKFIDSLKKVELAKENKPKIFPFNPNFITDYRAYTLGISTEEYERLKEFRNQDQWINSVEDFQKVTKISDSLLAEISPYFKFPEWVEKQNQIAKTSNQSTQRKLTKVEKSDLNEATIEDLQEIKGIGEVLSKRIVRYRSQIGGFLDDIQLKDIYGLKYETRNAITEKFTVKNSKPFEKIDLNTAKVVDLVEVYYIHYELARRIINYRITREKITSFEELAEIQGFPYDKMDRLKLYLKI